jgi:hypothetical protein
MDIFNKQQVIAQGSLDDFAEWAACNKVYLLKDTYQFIAIRNQQEEYTMVLDPRYMNAELVYCKGTYIDFDWESLFIEKVVGKGKTLEEAVEDATKCLKNDAMIIGNPRVITSGSQGVTEVEGLTEQEVRAKWIQICKNPQFVLSDSFSGAMAGATPTSKILKIECVQLPQTSMFGMNKKTGVWNFYWMNEWVVEISYR